MLQMKWKKLKSGADIRGVAAPSFPGEEITLSEETVTKIAMGFALWLSEQHSTHKAVKVAVGSDPRPTSPRLRQIVIDTLNSVGFQVVDCGWTSTPAMFMALMHLGCDGAVQITASHQPAHYNGMKFFGKNGALDSTDIVSILECAQRDEKLSPAQGTVSSCNFMEVYAAGLRKMICNKVGAPDREHPLTGYKIIVDAGNGAGGFFATDVLQPLGADITGSRRLEPDGSFPHGLPDPEEFSDMTELRRIAAEQKADLAILFDADADRAVCVDSRGEAISRNRLVALASAIALEGNPGGTIVTDSITSNGLKTFIEKDLGGKHRRFRRGYKNVINEAIRLNDLDINTPLAVETSGHVAFRENAFLDDGAYLMTKIIVKIAQLGAQGRSLEHLIQNLGEPAEAVELRFAITSERFAEYGKHVLSALLSFASEKKWYVSSDNHEGIRVNFDKGKGDGWFLFRLSVHDPSMPLNVESDTPGGVKIIVQQLQEFLQTCDQLDLSPLEEILK